MLHLGIFYMPQIYDMGPPALLPLWRKVCWGFFTLKNPTASARFEPANSGTKGQHAAPRPPKPLYSRCTSEPSAACKVVISLIMNLPSREVQVCLWMFHCGNICALDHWIFVLPIVVLKMSPIPSFTSDSIDRIFFWGLQKRSNKMVKQSRYRPGVAQRVPGS
jgi:hypothetical protein